MREGKYGRMKTYYFEAKERGESLKIRRTQTLQQIKKNIGMLDNDSIHTEPEAFGQ